MSEIWQRNIRTCRNLIEQGYGPRLVNIVSGSQGDQAYWQDHLEATRQDIFRLDGMTQVLSSLESSRKGNFLGSLNAWQEIQQAFRAETLPSMILMNMVFGQGKRLSPFTQALVNRKPAFPTPMCSSSQGRYLTTADIAAMSAVLWQHHLESHGFKGAIVKWGDEAVIPGRVWDTPTNGYENVDGVRFIWQTEPTQDLAREKEWVEFDEPTSQMTFQYTRQGLDSLRERLSHHGQGRCVGVNLGSLAISYPLLQAAENIFRRDVADGSAWVDWDPYTWIALSCRDEAEWRAEANREQQAGKTGIYDLEKRVPEFFAKIQQVRRLFRERCGRDPVIKVLDFGEPYWMDWGLHLSMRRSLDTLISDSDLGLASRDLFSLPHERDARGNILVGSEIPAAADIRTSLLVNTIITDPATVIHSGLVVAGRHQQVNMPDGGAALFCAGSTMKFTGPHAIAFYAAGESFSLQPGDRLTNLYLSDGTVEMRSNEALLGYEGENYSRPVMHNPFSFEEAARRMTLEDTRLVEKRWLDQWKRWPA